MHSGKRVLVTGAGTGIGRAIALQFAREGADVVLHYSRDSGGAASAAAEIRDMGRRAATLAADFNDHAQVLALGEGAIEVLGGIDVLVNNAGITFNKPFDEITLEQFDVMMHVNLRAQFFLTQRCVRDMLARNAGGAICNISSIHGVAGAPEHSLYAATKGAIIAYTRSLAVELAHKGIRVNAIAPGWVTVEGYKHALPGFDEDAAKRDANNKIPLGRSGEKDEIAKVATFLCSDAAAYIIGQTIVVDGGTSALMSLISDFRTRSTAQFGANYLPPSKP
jgi:NAD(P)-dependent dehydrogenase (short-subunit alcohol dehydrogenase family)